MPSGRRSFLRRSRPRASSTACWEKAASAAALSYRLCSPAFSARSSAEISVRAYAAAPSGGGRSTIPVMAAHPEQRTLGLSHIPPPRPHHQDERPFGAGRQGFRSLEENRPRFSWTSHLAAGRVRRPRGRPADRRVEGRPRRPACRASRSICPRGCYRQLPAAPAAAARRRGRQRLDPPRPSGRESGAAIFARTWRASRRTAAAAAAGIGQRRRSPEVAHGRLAKGAANFPYGAGQPKSPGG